MTKLWTNVFADYSVVVLCRTPSNHFYKFLERQSPNLSRECIAVFSAYFRNFWFTYSDDINFHMSVV